MPNNSKEKVVKQIRPGMIIAYHAETGCISFWDEDNSKPYYFAGGDNKLLITGLSEKQFMGIASLLAKIHDLEITQLSVKDGYVRFLFK
ncbi:MAG: hypothetical protein GF365_04815 [Candidatus Buchananbacteria bacterium]|nr:hypothetical protein [Candidatus Buchananbacteria bacterium]